jgi:hypothetical protein
VPFEVFVCNFILTCLLLSRRYAHYHEPQAASRSVHERVVLLIPSGALDGIEPGQLKILIPVLSQRLA